MLPDMVIVKEKKYPLPKKICFLHIHTRKQRRRSSLFSLHRQNHPSASYIQKFKPLTIFCGCKARLVFELVGNHRVRVSCDVAQIHTRLTMYYIRALIYDFLSVFLYVLVLEALRSVLETLKKYTHVHSKNV